MFKAPGPLRIMLHDYRCVQGKLDLLFLLDLPSNRHCLQGIFGTLLLNPLPFLVGLTMSTLSRTTFAMIARYWLDTMAGGRLRVQTGSYSGAPPARRITGVVLLIGTRDVD
ncbi:hypothetical protein Slin14017_G067950 [Septoria linicola]|nr:hypothetical protein Slin14017_G067950 [Septoria linicola]